MKKRKSKKENDSDREQHEEKSELPKKIIKLECYKSTFFGIIFLILIKILLVILYYGYSINSFNELDLDLFHGAHMGPEIKLLYQKYDRNDDGLLDINEFEPLAHRILTKTEFEINETISEEDEFITLNAIIEPMSMETKDSTHSDLFNNKHATKFLRKWREPNIDQQNFGCKDFVHLLPKNDNIILGKVYDLIPRLKSRIHLSNNRYTPSKPDPKELIIYRLLKMFHPRPFLVSRFPPQGTSLVVRAQNKKYIDIMFRIHAEFQLNEPPYFPFWFTPAQFNGRIIIAKDFSHIEYFHLYLPTKKQLNIDMEWINDDKENMEVDIGFVNRMEIQSSMPSQKVKIQAQDDKGNLVDINRSNNYLKPMNQSVYNVLLNSMSWDQEISISEADSLLEKSFYPFKEIEYCSFLEA